MYRLLLISVVILLSFPRMRAEAWRPWPGNRLLAGKEVYSLFIDKNGRMYVGTDKGLYSSDSRGTKMVSMDLRNRFGQTNVTVRYIDASRAVTLEDVYDIKDRAAHRLRSAMDTDLYIRSFTDTSGARWVYDRRLPSLVRTDGNDTIAIPDVLAGKIVTGMARIGKSRIAVATNNDGIFVCDLHGHNAENHRRSSEGNGCLPGNHVMDICFDDHTQTLYAAIPKAGIWSLDVKPHVCDEFKTGIDEDISSIVRDRGGRLWVSYDGGGIQILDRQMNQLRHLTQKSCGMPSDVITALYPLGSGRMLASTYGKGVFTIDADGNWQSLDGLDESSPAAQCRSIGMDRLGNMWVATFTKGVVRVSRDGNISVFTGANSALRTDYITDLKTSTDGDSIFVATGFGLYAFDIANLTSTALNPPDGEPLRIRQMAINPADHPVLGTDKGVFDRYGRNIALAGVSIKAICCDSTGGTWCASDSSLYYICAAGEVRHIGTPAGRSFDNYALMVDKNGETFAGSFGAIIIADSDVEAAAPSSSSFRWIWIAVIVATTVLAGLIIGVRTIRRRPKAEVAETKKPTAVPDNCGQAAVDKQWLETASALVRDNMSDSSFGVEEFSRGIGMSRSNLYKKLLSLTGKAPQEYIRDMRLEAGRNILEENKGSHIRLTLAEVAYRVGMSPRQFSRYLRETNTTKQQR